MVPVYICTGFLDSGKTTLVKDTLMKQEWIEDGRTLLLMCEEGEIEYSQEYLKENNMVLIRIEEFSQLTLPFFKNCERMYRPEQIIIEYNGMWSFEDLLSLRFPRNWELEGIYSTVDGQTLDMYMKNMRNLLMDQLKESSLIVVNRCPESLNRANFRRSLKIQNPNAQLIFEGLDGEIIPHSAEDLPYDVTGETISIADDDFGVWFVDAVEHPEYYDRKIVEFKAQTIQPKQFPDNMFVPVRQIMTCCADDVGLYGYPCRMKEADPIEKMQWVKIKARVRYPEIPDDPEVQPALFLIDMEQTSAPEKEVVYMM